MAALLAAIVAAVVFLVAGGSSSAVPTSLTDTHDSRIAALAAPRPAPEPASIAERLGDRAQPSEQLKEASAALSDEALADGSAAANPCVRPDGTMYPDCASISRERHKRVSSERSAVNDWIYLWMH